MFDNLIDFKSIILLLKGTFITIKIFFGTIFISLFLGTFLGILSSNKFNFIVSRFIRSITFVIRAIPSYVLVLFVYYGIPKLSGISLPIELAAITALGVNASCFVSQIFSSGINSIDIGQWQAAFIVGLNKFKTLKVIVLPQLIKNTLPIFISEYTHMIKSTSAISSLGLLEVTKNGMKLVEQGKNPIVIYSIVAIIYILISLVVIMVGKKLKKKMKYDLW